MRRLTALLLALLALLLPTALPAHLTPNSELTLDFAPDQVVIDAIMPEADYRTAAASPPGRTAAARAQARRWLATQVAATSPDGRAWSVMIDSAEFVQRSGPPDLHARIRLIPPQGADPRRFALRWSAVVAQNPDHFALLVVGADLAGGVVRTDRRLLGAVRGTQQIVAIDRGAASRFAAFAAAFRLGVHHILMGTDHLLFLLALMLPAPLMAAAGRWSQPRAARATLRAVALLVTAFTLGHSLTLLLAALGQWRLPAAPVEALIALSILVAAIHAARPLFPGREAWVAAGFGLVHGLAFATLVGEAGIGTGDRLAAILGFNLGIEAVQLAVASAALLPLLLLTPLAAYAPLRIGGALFAGVAACGWLWERVTGADLGMSALGDSLADSAPWLLLALIALALSLRWRARTAASS